MYRTKESELRFTHFVVSKTDGSIFASARDKQGRVHNFLINIKANTVKEQVRRNFEELAPDRAESVRASVQSAYNTPVYHTRTLMVS